MEAWVKSVWVFVVLVLIWWVLDGLQSPAWGVVAAALGAALYHLLAHGPRYRVRLLNLPQFAAYFVLESFRGGWDVARRALDPGLPIHPHLFDYAVRLPAGQPRGLFMGVIGLLPGTLSADLSANGQVIRVHAIHEDPASAVQELERRVARLYGLEGGA
nr:Na+/H+ antiporter subunit E [Halorhodospira sp. 9621]